MAPAAAPTIPTIKQNFLTTQTRLLSQPLQPSRAWRRANDSAEDAVSEKAVDDALFRLNHTLQQHARRVYAPQATRHVAEQIDKLYLSVADRRVAAAAASDDEDEGGAGGGLGGGGGGRGGDDDAARVWRWRDVGADHADARVISSLPPAWESEREVEAHPLEAGRYAELVTRLQDLSARRQEAEARVRRLRRVRSLVAPFGAGGDEDAGAAGGGGGGGVQENLVTRDGEVEKELERMRMLLVRVGDKVGRLRGREGDDEDEDLFGDGDAMIVDDVEVEERRKVEGLLDVLV